MYLQVFWWLLVTSLVYAGLLLAVEWRQCRRSGVSYGLRRAASDITLPLQYVMLSLSVICTERPAFRGQGLLGLCLLAAGVWLFIRNAHLRREGMLPYQKGVLRRPKGDPADE